MSDEARLLDRLSRRGELKITATDGMFAVAFKAPGPYRGRAWCTTDEADLYEHCHLGAKSWYGEGPDFAALLVLCEMETRPRNRDIDDLVWEIERRRVTRTAGPPLPSFMRWQGWRPGDERWLRTSDHKFEYLVGYLRDCKEAAGFEAEQRASQERAERRERDRVRRVLEGSL